MAILRCNKCGHVAEALGEHAGKSIACPNCGNEVQVYDTVLFVRKVLQQYFALQEETVRLRAQIPATDTATATPSATGFDIHNTAHLASDAQHTHILQWFQRRQVQAFTTAEVVIDHRPRDVRFACDLFQPGALQPPTGELL